MILFGFLLGVKKWMCRNLKPWQGELMFMSSIFSSTDVRLWPPSVWVSQIFELLSPRDQWQRICENSSSLYLCQTSRKTRNVSPTFERNGLAPICFFNDGFESDWVQCLKIFVPVLYSLPLTCLQVARVCRFYLRLIVCHSTCNTNSLICPLR